jgi:hypothetical protein
MSLDSTCKPAVAANAFTIGKNEYVANAGASSVSVYRMVEFEFAMILCFN